LHPGTVKGNPAWQEQSGACAPPAITVFAGTAPGLEPFAAAELLERGCGDVTQGQGGVTARVHKTSQLPNLARHLRCAENLLWRIAQGPAREPTDIARLVDRLPWGLLPVAIAQVRVHLSGHRTAPDRILWVGKEFSRIVSRRTQSPCDGGTGIGDPRELVVALRLVGHTCTVSLDVGGRPLHRRGWRLDPGRAPLREDVAAAVLRAAGWRGHGTLWDPMTGSGTLAIEAATLAKPAASIAADGWRLPPTDLAPAAVADATIHAGDRARESVARARQNAERAGVAAAMSWHVGDIAVQPVPRNGTGIVVVNPPWGDRLGGIAAARRTMERVAAVLARDRVGWRAAFVVPQPTWGDLVPLRDRQQWRVTVVGRTVWIVAGTVDPHAGRRS
jgi:putative N6-adenine-specific DNA methylase